MSITTKQVWELHPKRVGKIKITLETSVFYTGQVQRSNEPLVKNNTVYTDSKVPINENFSTQTAPTGQKHTRFECSF